MEDKTLPPGYGKGGRARTLGVYTGGGLGTLRVERGNRNPFRFNGVGSFFGPRAHLVSSWSYCLSYDYRKRRFQYPGSSDTSQTYCVIRRTTTRT